MTNTTKRESGSTSGVARTGTITVAAIAAIVAGAYFLVGKHARQHRRVVKGWAVQAKGEVLEKLEQVKDVNLKQYTDTINEVLEHYATIKKASVQELKALRKELEGYWEELENEVKEGGKSVKKAIKSE